MMLAMVPFKGRKIRPPARWEQEEGRRMGKRQSGQNRAIFLFFFSPWFLISHLSFR